MNEVASENGVKIVTRRRCRLSDNEHFRERI